jgi:hypothetical protein
LRTQELVIILEFERANLFLVEVTHLVAALEFVHEVQEIFQHTAFPIEDGETDLIS